MMDRDAIVAYLKESIATFVDDPADSSHQEGYLEALEETLRVIEGDGAGGLVPDPRRRPQLRVVK